MVDRSRKTTAGGRRDSSLVLSATPAPQAREVAFAAAPPPDQTGDMSDEPSSFSEDGPPSPLVARADSWLDSGSAPSSAEMSTGPEGPAAEPALPAAGGETRVGRYQILELIGKGGYGRVYKAWDPQLEREVAVKVLLRTDTNAYRRFSREIKLTARLRHPNIVTVYDSGASQGLPFLVMDYVPGRSLWELGKSLHELPPADSARIMRDAAGAIACAHDQGVLHRDIKPANVLVTPEGHAFVVDFGLARTEEMEKLTQTGAVLGTPLFMPIEQAQAKQVPDELCDVYALGATLYYALTGRPPHVAESLKELIAGMAHLPEAPSALNPLVPPGLDAVCLHALMPDRAKRTPSAKAFAAELDGFLGAGRPASAAPIDLAGSARRVVRRSAELSGACAKRLAPAVALLRQKVRGREKLVLTGGYAAVVTLVCASLLLRGQRTGPVESGAAAAASTATSPAAGAETNPAVDIPAPETAAAPEPAAATPDLDPETRVERALATARGRAGGDLERQACLLEQEPGGLRPTLEVLHRQVSAAEPNPAPELLGLLGILLSRDGPEQAALARPLLDRALVHGKERTELLFWRGVSAAASGDLGQAERDWVRARERDPVRIVDLRARHAAVVPPAARELVARVAPLPLEKGALPTPPHGRAPETALERIRVLAAQLPPIAREDMIAALGKCAEGKRWSELKLTLQRLDRFCKDSPLANAIRTRFLVGRGRIVEAREALEAARKLGAPAAELDRLEVEILWRSGRTQEAAVAAQALGAREPGPEGRVAAALAHHLRGRHLEALGEARLGLAQDADHVPCLLLQSLSLAELDEPWGALGAARRAHELEGLTDELVVAAWMRALIGTMASSGAELEQSKAVTTAFALGFSTLHERLEAAFPCLLLVRAGIDLGEHELAETWLLYAAQRGPGMGEVELLRGALALASGGEQKAVDAAWSEARRLDPHVRIEAGWAESYKKRFKREPELKASVQ